jgi:cytochrome c2
MPATEQTWRPIGLMHVIFGLSSIAMLVTTIWMLAADHRREWKKYQREFRNVKIAATEARISELKTTQWSQKKRELDEAVAQARQVPPPADLVELFRATINKRYLEDQTAARESDAERIKTLYQDVTKAAEAGDKQAIARARGRLLDEMNRVITQARTIAIKVTGDVKFKKADLDVRRSEFDIAVRDERPQPVIDAAQKAVRDQELEVDRATRLMQAANTYRHNLERIVADITKQETLAKKARDDHDSTLERLQTQEQEQYASWGERILELPIIDAFGRPLKVDQIWLPKLTINYNFRDVARFDRCTTCHQGIAASAAGTASDPAYPQQQQLTFRLDTPAERPAVHDNEGKPVTPSLEQVYGMRLFEKPFNPYEVRIAAVWQEGLAAKAAQLRTGGELPVEAENPPGTFSDSELKARVYELPPGLRAGDVIVRVNDVLVDDAAAARRELLDDVVWGQPVTLTIKRGIAQPYSSHPRLDLYLSSSSPHDIQKIGCTICHDGQGSATSFHWASHTPNSQYQREAWSREYRWSENHHWIFPMFPKRFAESTCLKCHHDVVELMPSQRFPDPPAPKLMEGYNIVREYGCFGCHEINGFDGPRRIGPDLRAEPNFVAAALQLLTDKGLTDEEISLARHVVADPTNTADRQRLAQIIKSDQSAVEGGQPRQPRLSASSYKLADLLGANEQNPGQLRKVGPSLRYLASKVDFDFAYDWIRNPKHFRPSTKMPRFFGLYDHLLPEEKVKNGRTVMETANGLKVARRYEPIEVRAITRYLLNHSQPFEYLDPPKEVTEEPSAERGRSLFETRGCLACHKHPDFPDAQATHGPDLARLGDKLRSADGKRWLYTWLRDPTLYHARTFMPNLFLTPITSTRDGKTMVTDPAADIAAFLVANSENVESYQPAPAEELDEEALDELVMLGLKKVFTEVQAKEYLEKGIPEFLAGEIKGDEVALIGDASTDKKLEYIGRRALNKYGCFGCHDVPGYELAKPIGTTLADWGRKEPDKLAFEQISGLVERIERHGAGHAGSTRPQDTVLANLQTAGPAPLAQQALKLEQYNLDGYFLPGLLNHDRQGFLWQKLRAPRSYDYMKTDTKEYNDRLRMPQFSFTPRQIEAVMTFILGLLAEPPATQYVYHPTDERRAIIEGQKLLEKYNCGGCHPLQLARWKFEYDPKTFPAAQEFNDYAFLKPYFSAEQLAQSKQTDRRGMGVATVHGLPVVDAEGKLVQDEDDNGNPLYYFTLWENKPINGEAWLSGSQVQVSRPQLIETRPPVGGYLARLIYPTVLAHERESNPNVKESDAWGWVPPPLVGEGLKVQTAWLHDFLLDPYPIRPAAVLRMPRFNMSSAEAQRLVDYFAAVAGAEYPFEFDPRTRAAYLAEAEAKHPHRLDDALKIVTNGNYCVKCHLLGDYQPEGSVAAYAPQLDRVYNRLRPEFLRNWLANPQRILPYTPMPVNFPPQKPADQTLFPGTSEEQVTAVVDLLLNYDSFMKARQSIRPLIQAAPAAEQQAQQELPITP